MIKSVFIVLFVILFAGLTRVDSVRVSELGSCPVVSITDSILGFQDSVCRIPYSYDVSVIEGDGGTLEKALQLVYSRNQDYLAVLFYASWCPFSRKLRSSFSILSALYPSIPHFANEESAVKPSVFSKYGVHGFPTIFLLNSTTRVRYRGTRSLSSLVHFYSDVTGMEGDPRDELPFEKIESDLNQGRKDDNEERENLLPQDTYIVLATVFVLLRLMYLLFPYLVEFARSAWRRYMQHVRVSTLLEHPLRYLNTAKQVLCSFKGPRKGSNFQEGAINARAWASKSLASAVSATSSASH